MSELISTTELAGILDRPDLRLFDCTTTGAPPPTITPPTSTPTEVRRGKGEEKYPVMPAASCLRSDVHPS